MHSRLVYITSAVFVALAGYACWCQAPLIWDGAYQFDATLIMQRPFIYETRFHTFFFWWPTVWASRHCASVPILQSLFGLPFLLTPPVSLLLSWWMVRAHAPRLILWQIFGMAACLPGQIFVINDSIVQLYLFWPIFLSLFVPLSPVKKIAIGFLCLSQFVHPVGILLLLGATGTALILAAVEPETLRRMLFRAFVMGGLCTIAFFKVVVVAGIARFNDLYSINEAKWSTAIQRWHLGVAGLPLRGLCFIWAAGAIVVLAQLPVRRSNISTRKLTLAFIFLGAAIARTFGYEPPEVGDELTAWGLFYLCVLLVLDARRTAIRTAALLLIAGVLYSVIEIWLGHLDGAGLVATEIDCVAIFSFLLCTRQWADHRKILGIMALLSALIGVTYWLDWAADATRWSYAIDYRRWVGPLAMPFFAFTLLDVLWTGAARARWTSAIAHTATGVLEWLAIIVSTACAIVLTVQYSQWHRMTTRLMAQVASYPSAIVPMAAVPWVAHTALGHWTICDYVMSQEGKTPAKLPLDDFSRRLLRQTPPKLPHWDWCPYLQNDEPSPSPGPMGWFDMRPWLARVNQKPKVSGGSTPVSHAANER